MVLSFELSTLMFKLSYTPRLFIPYMVSVLLYFKKLKKKKMPQLVPFYFINQVTFAFVLLPVMIFVLSKYILPRFVILFLSRLFISKL